MKALSAGLLLAAALVVAPLGIAAAQEAATPQPGQMATPEAGKPAAKQKMHIEGTVDKVDAAHRKITIDGESYGVGKKVNLSQVKEGERVKATIVTSKSGAKMVHALKPAGGAATSAPAAPAPAPGGAQ